MLHIWQINRDVPGARDLLFESFSHLNKIGRKPEKKNYKCVFSEENEQNISLESVFVRFNIYIPEGYTGHSLSVSDVIEQNGRFFFVDSFGFVDITAYF